MPFGTGQFPLLRFKRFAFLFAAFGSLLALLVYAADKDKPESASKTRPEYGAAKVGTKLHAPRHEERPTKRPRPPSENRRRDSSPLTTGMTPGPSRPSLLPRPSSSSKTGLSSADKRPSSDILPPSLPSFPMSLSNYTSRQPGW